MIIEEACSMLTDISGIDFTILRERKDYVSFCSKHCFHKIQKLYTMPFLFNIVNKELNDNIIYHTEDQLMMHTNIVRLGNEVVIIGPYTTSDLTEANVRVLFERKNIDSNLLPEYRAYRSNYPMTRTENIDHSCQIMLVHCGYDIKSIQNLEVSSIIESSQGWQYTVKNYENIVNERYRVEREFMNQVARGETDAAIKSYRYLHNNVKFMGHIGGTPDGSRISSGITRTTVRVAAMEAGLPPLIIDSVSGESSRRIMNCQSREEMYKENERMIRAFTTAINRYKNNSYSPMVMNAVYYLETNFWQDVYVEELADRMGVAVSTLIRNFRKETGKTPGAYLLEYRIRMARRQLRTTQLSISDIAAKVGIHDGNYFVKCFRKITGMTPSQFRKENVQS